MERESSESKNIMQSEDHSYDVESSEGSEDRRQKTEDSETDEESDDDDILENAKDCSQKPIMSHYSTSQNDTQSVNHPFETVS